MYIASGNRDYITPSANLPLANIIAAHRNNSTVSAESYNVAVTCRYSNDVRPVLSIQLIVLIVTNYHHTTAILNQDGIIFTGCDVGGIADSEFHAIISRKIIISLLTRFSPCLV